MHRSKYILTGILIIASLIAMSITFPYRNSDPTKTEKNDPVQQVPAKKFSAVVIDNENIKWFLTELGIVSFDGEKWKLHKDDSRFPGSNFAGLALEVTPERSVIWLASANGAIAASLPPDTGKESIVYLPENSGLNSRNILRIEVGKSPMRWFGTDKGLSGLRDDKWLAPDYNAMYPERIFATFPIISMAASHDGDTLFVGTAGAGVARVFRNDVDAISGASSYAMWGPIILPSDYIYSIFIASDGSQWFGTDKGVARHAGNNTLDNWTVYSTEEGLVNNFVQAITSDKTERLWFGTKDGISVFNGSTWTTYKTVDGLTSNNILCLGLDRDGVIWIGTDNGVNSFSDGIFTSYK